MMLKEEFLNVVFLMETKMVVGQLECIRLCTKMHGCLGVDRVVYGGGLALSWQSHVDLKFLSFSGDYNEIIEFCDKLGGQDRHQLKIDRFRNSLDFCSLQRIYYIGYKYTWTKNREDGINIKKLVDHGFANIDGHLLFRHAIVQHNMMIALDNHAFLLCLNGFESRNFFLKYGHRFHFESG